MEQDGNKKKQEIVQGYLNNPETMLQKKPFTRGAKIKTDSSADSKKEVDVGETITVTSPRIKRFVVPQEQFALELDPDCHKILSDENVPSITMKLKDGSFYEIEYKRTSIPFQKKIAQKQTLHLAALPIQHTLEGTDPTEQMQKDFINFKEYWKKRNQEGMKYKMIYTQKTQGDAGLLYYFSLDGEIKSRLLTFADGYVLCPHNDDNGDRVLESVYYVKDEVEYIDSYDDHYMYRCMRKTDAQVVDGDPLKGWVFDDPVEHGFEEIPLISKRGDVAWNGVQSDIESYEVLYNIFNVIQKRWGWGILYVRGRFKDEAKKIAGSIVLNDTSMDQKGDAKFLTPPTPQGTIDTLKNIKRSIQEGSSTTFIMPDDIHISGDISGIAIMLTLSMDIECATNGSIEWQNVFDKMTRLFKYGLAKELVNKGIDETAITRYESMQINASQQVWKPMSATEYNNMLIALKQAGLLSQESGIELNTESKPNEKARVKKEAEEAAEAAAQGIEIKTGGKQAKQQ